MTLKNPYPRDVHEPQVYERTSVHMLTPASLLAPPPQPSLSVSVNCRTKKKIYMLCITVHSIRQIWKFLCIKFYSYNFLYVHAPQLISMLKKPTVFVTTMQVVMFRKQLLVLVCEISHRVQWRVAVKWSSAPTKLCINQAHTYVLIDLRSSNFSWLQSTSYYGVHFFSLLVALMCWKESVNSPRDIFVRP